MVGHDSKNQTQFIKSGYKNFENTGDISDLNYEFISSGEDDQAKE